MATYKVVLERPIYESAIVYVDADSEANAIDEAMALDTFDMDWELTAEGCGEPQVVYSELENV